MTAGAEQCCICIEPTTVRLQIVNIQSPELTRCCIRSSAKEREFTSLVSRERQRYFWTGGRMSGGRVTWPSGRQYTQVNWSHTGG